MWKAAGLDLDESGRIIPNCEIENRHGNDNHSQEDMIANSLVLLLSKLNNYIAAGESLFPAPAGFEDEERHEDRLQGIEHLAVSQQTLLERWDRIRQEIDTWYLNLPQTFQPSARISHPVFSEIWYSIPMCASAMQNYHVLNI